MDEETQFEVVGTVEKISEQYLIPVLERFCSQENPYKSMMTPYDKLKSLPESEKHLKEGVTFEIMDKIAFAMTDNQSADRLQKARQSLFKTIDERDLNAG